LPGKTPDLLASLNERIARMDSSYRPDKPFVKVKFHDFSQTTLEQAGQGGTLRVTGSCSARRSRGGKPVRLLGVGVRLRDLRGAHEQLELFDDT
jgi:DNA polymerase-4